MNWPEARERPKETFPTSDLWIIAGEPKSGKTTFCAEGLPNSLLLDLEGGAKRCGGSILRIENMTQFGDAMKNLMEDCPFDWVIIDTMDELNTWFEPQAVAMTNERQGGEVDYKTLQEIPYGAGYGPLRELWYLLVRQRLRKLPCNAVLLAHCKRMIDEDSGELSKAIDLPGKLSHMMPAEMDHIAFAKKYLDDDTGEISYVLDFCGYEGKGKSKAILMAGSRDTALNGKEFPQNLEALKGAYE